MLHTNYLRRKRIIEVFFVIQVTVLPSDMIWYFSFLLFFQFLFCISFLAYSKSLNGKMIDIILPQMTITLQILHKPVYILYQRNVCVYMRSYSTWNMYLNILEKVPPAAATVTITFLLFSIQYWMQKNEMVLKFSRKKKRRKKAKKKFTWRSGRPSWTNNNVNTFFNKSISSMIDEY